MLRSWLCSVTGGLVLGFAAAGAFAATVIVPTDQPTVQGAVNAAGAGGTVVINSNAIFDETVTVIESLTLRAGNGFKPTIRGTSPCFNFDCTLFFHPNSAAAQTLVVQGLRLLPKSGALGNGAEVVQVLNSGSGDANMTLERFKIENPEGFGFQAVDIRSATCPGGLNHVTVQNGSIHISGANEAFGGSGGFVMDEAGSLMVSDIDMTITGISADAFDIIGQPACGGIIFELMDSTVKVSPPTAPFSADIARLLLDVTAIVERNSFHAISNNEGSVSGILAGGGSGQTFSTVVTLDANRFFGSGPNVGDAVEGNPFADGSVTMTATNNVVRNMQRGFRLGRSVGNPAGVVTATLTNNTVDGSRSDAIALRSALDSRLTITAVNNLLTHSRGWGISLSSETGDDLALTNDYNGFFENGSGNVEPPLADGPNDVVGNPIYVNRPIGDLRLGIGSPMIDVGNNALALTATDADGAPRIQNGTVDIGAFEGGFPVIRNTGAPVLGGLGLVVLASLLAIMAGLGLRRGTPQNRSGAPRA